MAVSGIKDGAADAADGCRVSGEIPGLFVLVGSATAQRHTNSAKLLAGPTKPLGEVGPPSGPAAPAWCLFRNAYLTVSEEGRTNRELCRDNQIWVFQFKTPKSGWRLSRHDHTPMQCSNEKRKRNKKETKPVSQTPPTPPICWYPWTKGMSYSSSQNLFSSLTFRMSLLREPHLLRRKSQAASTSAMDAILNLLAVAQGGRVGIGHVAELSLRLASRPSRPAPRPFPWDDARLRPAPGPQSAPGRAQRSACTPPADLGRYSDTTGHLAIPN